MISYDKILFKIEFYFSIFNNEENKTLIIITNFRLLYQLILTEKFKRISL